MRIIVLKRARKQLNLIPDHIYVEINHDQYEIIEILEVNKHEY